MARGRAKGRTRRCYGFHTSAGMGRVAEDIVRAKLKALTEGARIADGRLF